MTLIAKIAKFCMCK